MDPPDAGQWHASHRCCLIYCRHQALCSCSSVLMARRACWQATAAKAGRGSPTLSAAHAPRARPPRSRAPPGGAPLRPRGRRGRPRRCARRETRSAARPAALPACRRAAEPPYRSQQSRPRQRVRPAGAKRTERPLSALRSKLALLVNTTLLHTLSYRYDKALCRAMRSKSTHLPQGRPPLANDRLRRSGGCEPAARRGTQLRTGPADVEARPPRVSTGTLTGAHASIAATAICDARL